MSIFGISNIVTKFSKLQKEVDAFVDSQRKVVEVLEGRTLAARAEQATALRIATSLRKLSIGE